MLIQIQEPIKFFNIGIIQNSACFKKEEEVIRIAISKKDKNFLVLSQKDNEKHCQACIQQYEISKKFSNRIEAENEFIKIGKSLVDKGYQIYKH